jgi:hypothetical protein
MEFVNPDALRLVPGQSIHGIFITGPGEAGEVGLFIRSLSGVASDEKDIWLKQRAGLIRFDDVLLVLTMIRVNGAGEELFDVWWNYHSSIGPEYFKRMAEQEKLTVHFYGEDGKRFSIETENGFQKFFSDLDKIIAKISPWTEVEFDRALRGFCAESYPKENLWEMIEFRPDSEKSEDASEPGLQTYPGVIPAELAPFYVYVPGQGHCINIVPSLLEKEAAEGDPTGFLHPAPVKTVLRCGIRWVQGHPVAPIPFIPGHGLAVPPDDVEL